MEINRRHLYYSLFLNVVLLGVFMNYMVIKNNNNHMPVYMPNENVSDYSNHSNIDNYILFSDFHNYSKMRLFFLGDMIYLNIRITPLSPGYYSLGDIFMILGFGFFIVYYYYSFYSLVYEVVKKHRLKKKIHADIGGNYVKKNKIA